MPTKPKTPDKLSRMKLTPGGLRVSAELAVMFCLMADDWVPTPAERLRLLAVAVGGTCAEIFAAMDEICGDKLQAAIAAGNFPPKKKKPHNRDRGDKK